MKDTDKFQKCLVPQVLVKKSIFENTKGFALEDVGNVMAAKKILGQVARKFLLLFFWYFSR